MHLLKPTEVYSTKSQLEYMHILSLNNFITIYFSQTDDICQGARSQMLLLLANFKQHLGGQENQCGIHSMTGEANCITNLKGKQEVLT